MSTVSVKCFDNNCQESFVSIAALHCHSYIKHPMCNTYICKVIESCVRKFDKWDSYRKHISKQHKIPNHFQSQDVQVPFQEYNNFQSEDVEQFDYNYIDDCDFSQLNNILMKNATLFVAKLYSKSDLPRNHVDEIIKDITSFFSDTFAAVNWCKIVKTLKLAHVESKIISTLENVFTFLNNPFSKLSTEYLRTKYFQSTGDYIPPETYVIDSRVEREVTRGTVKGKMRNVTGQFVPLRKVLKNFFELPDALPSTLKYMENLESTSSVFITNIIQCQKWQTIKTHLYNSNDKVIPLIIYYDDWEPNNALGPHSEKIGCVYANLPSLPEECQSKLDNIFEVLIFNADDRKSYGNKKTFRPLVEELKYLETEGVLINTPQGEVKVFFPTVLLIGDNLGINSMCGFVESFSASYMCRFCKVSKNTTKSMTVEDLTCLRDSENYTNDVTINDWTKTGIKEEFVFKDIKSLCYGNVTHAFTVDCMHDGLEGIGHYTMIPVLNHLLDLDPLFLETLNCRMYMFNYGPDVNNKPPSVTREILKMKKLKMTASEMIVFVKYFGLFVGDIVAEDDEFWQLYLHLYDVFDIIYSRRLTIGDVTILQNIVSEHHKLYMKLTGETLKPKHHFLLHYPRLFLLNGPFAPISSMRNEGKHKALKKYTNVCMSRRNIIHSLAVKRQIAHSYRFILKESLLPKTIIGSGNYQDVRNSVFFVALQKYFPEISENSFCYCTKWVEVKGTLYKNGMAISCGVDESRCPTFSKIETICITNRNDVIFICSPMTTLGLNAHNRGFEVIIDKSKELLCLLLNFLENPFPLCIVTSPTGEKYIIPKR